MTEKKTYIIGDVHGCADALRRLMEKLPWVPERDALIFLGDLIDRGENSREVVEYVLELRRGSSGVRVLMGNHERMFLDYLNGRGRYLYFMNGGLATVRSYSKAGGTERNNLVPEEHLAFFNSLEKTADLGEYLVVHAGLRPGVGLEDQAEHDMLWIREPFISSTYDFGKRIVFGHTPFEEPLVMKNKIGIDTGAVYGGRLTCLEISETRFFSVKA